MIFISINFDIMRFFSICTKSEQNKLNKINLHQEYNILSPFLRAHKNPRQSSNFRDSAIGFFVPTLSYRRVINGGIFRYARGRNARAERTPSYIWRVDAAAVGRCADKWDLPESRRGQQIAAAVFWLMPPTTIHNPRRVLFILFLRTSAALARRQEHQILTTAFTPSFFSVSFFHFFARPMSSSEDDCACESKSKSAYLIHDALKSELSTIFAIGVYGRWFLWGIMVGGNQNVFFVFFSWKYCSWEIDFRNYSWFWVSIFSLRSVFVTNEFFVLNLSMN